MLSSSHSAAHRRRFPSSAEQAAEDIKDYIRSHALKPGDCLPSEADLCTELGFSRSSVREAIRTLATLDIVEVRHGTGTFVSGASLVSLIQGLIFRSSLDADDQLDTLRHVVEARQAMDLAIGSEVAGALTEDVLTQLREVVETMATQLAEGVSFADADRRFHQLLLTLVNNPIIRELNDAFWQVHMDIIPQRGLSQPHALDRTVQAHKDILTALEARNVDAYEDAVRAHYAPLLSDLPTGGVS